MYLSNESLLVILFVGVVAGWLAGKIVEGTGLGLVNDMIIGVVGAFAGDWLMPQLGIHLRPGIGRDHQRHDRRDRDPADPPAGPRRRPLEKRLGRLGPSLGQPLVVRRRPTACSADRQSPATACGR